METQQEKFTTIIFMRALPFRLYLGEQQLVLGAATLETLVTELSAFFMHSPACLTCEPNYTICSEMDFKGDILIFDFISSISLYHLDDED